MGATSSAPAVPSAKPVESGWLTAGAKVVLLGSQACGKTCLLIKKVKGEFMEEYLSTVCSSFLQHTVTVGDRVVKYQLWDTSGRDRDRALTPTTYRQYDVAVLVYDATDLKSFDTMKNWYTTCVEAWDFKVIVIVGTKIDLEGTTPTWISPAIVTDFLSSTPKKNLHTLVVRVSSKTGDGVSSLFEELSQKLLDLNTPTTPGLAL
ncbi:RAS family protein [Pelomyxa schiedti]|nr:RAS family protein [Pelomyxa schiedti]